jgi:hypothetical protein
MNVIEYVTEEVNRQGHDVTMRDGIVRVGWMSVAWAFALDNKNTPLTIGDIKFLGKLVEIEKNKKGFRTCGVRVGSRLCPPPDEVIPRLKRLLELYDSMTPIEWYKEFELCHPFVDGNGRCGKILLNWKNGTLLDPIFPPADLFGGWITNP